MNVNAFSKKDYDNVTAFRPKKNKPKTKPIFDYPCVFEWLLYNLVLRDGNRRNFDGEYMKWQMHRKQMR
jgi:hypothetical protein